MLGLAAYFDESGHSKDPKCRFVGMGGLFAPESGWSALDREWQKILDQQCRGVPFHMKDFANGFGIYEGWKEERKRKLLGDLATTILNSEARPFGVVVSLDAYDHVVKMFPGVDKEFFVDPYFLCFQDVTRAAAICAMQYNPPFAEGFEQVAMIYARQKSFGTISTPDGSDKSQMGQAERLWYAIKEFNPHFGRFMGAYDSGLPENLNFLQAADLFTYELTHEFENRVKRPKDDMRWALSELLPSSWRGFLHKFYGVPQLLDLLVESNRVVVTDEQRVVGSTNASLNNIMHSDLLFARMYKRRGEPDR